MEIDLIIRGICALRPGVKGLSENIRVRSIVGRFLEHSRIFYFLKKKKKKAEVFLGSADWMQRNLDRRVEVAVPIVDPEIADYLRHVLLEKYLKDNVNARVLKSDGTYRKIASGNAAPVDSQSFL